jgi:uncharacterized protein (DUF302 family)
LPDQSAGASGIVIKASPWSVDDTVARLSALIAKRGMKQFALIDHSGEALAKGLELRDTKVLIFGNAVGGTPVMDAVPLVALDLPLKVLVYDDDGETKVCYLPPAELARRYGIPDELAGRFDGINSITDAVIAEPDKL